MSQLWETLKKFTRKNRINRPLPVLKVNDVMIVDPSAVVNALGHCFSNISYRPPFLQHLTEMEVNFPDFHSDNQECYNERISFDELTEAVNKCGNTSVGPDSVHYAFLKHLDDIQLLELLKLYNYIWEERCFPASWTHSYIIPILKQGKPACEPHSYRPIQLTSCLCKVMERIISRRLTWYVEKEKLLSNFQCAFRKGRSTVDHIVRLESDIRRGFFFRQYTVAVFLDFKSAYNLVSPTALLTKMHSLGFRGRLMYFLKSYLGARSFQVKCGELSNTFIQETGLVQGGVISPLLFNIMINDIFDNIPDSFSYAIYADDCAVWTQGRGAARLVRSMQTTLDTLAEWAEHWGFTFTPAKCKAVIVRFF